MRFYVDWDDHDYPGIRIWREGLSETPLSLTEAKHEVIQRARSEQSHWRAIAQGVRELRLADFKEEDR